MATKNPFQQATQIAKRLKILIYGASGSGKTLAALSFPRPAVIDTENGTDLYVGRSGIPEFSVLRAKSLQEVKKAIEFIAEDNGATFETLVIDAITVLYDVQKEAVARMSKDGEMNPRLWNKVNGQMVALYNGLTNLPVHVVVIARESELYEGEGLNLKRTGVKPDGDKKMPYMFDFIVRMRLDHTGEVIKSRGVYADKVMPIVSWAAFEKAAGLFNTGESVATALSDEGAIEKDSRAYADVNHWSQEAGLMEAMYKWAKDNYKMDRKAVDGSIYASGKNLSALSRDEVKALIAAAAQKELQS